MRFNLTGEWEQDKELSESMYEHMKALGCDEIAALASEKLQVTMQVIQTDKIMAIWQQSQLGMVHRTLYLDKETIETSSQGERRVNVTIGPDEMIIETKFDGGSLVDTRTLREEQDQLVMNSQIILTLKSAPEPRKTTRIFRKVGEPNPEVVGASADLIATQCGLDIWNNNRPLDSRRPK